MKYEVYFDSGTTNSRLYLLNAQRETVYTAKCEVGARDSAKAHSGEVQTKALHEMYVRMLTEKGLSDADIGSVCVSGNVTAKYGVREVPHCVLPMSADRFREKLFTFTEDKYFGREITLVPGVKQVSDDIELTGLARGEEIELYGMADTLKMEYGDRTVAVAMPGSHTHVAFMQGDTIAGLNSNMTGEIFHALRADTVLAPVLEDVSAPLDDGWVLRGMDALNRYGITRALYLAHTMRILEQNEPYERRSFAEGVIFGGIAQSTKVMTERLFPGCRTLLIAADGEIGQLYTAVFSACKAYDSVKLLPAKDEPWSLMGYKKLFAQK